MRTSLPDAVRVLDAFHVVRLGQAAVDDVWRRRRQQTLGRRGTETIRPTGGAGCCAEGFTTLLERQWAKLEATLTVGDPSAQLLQA